MNMDESSWSSYPEKQEKAKTTTRAALTATFVAFAGTWHMGFSIGSVNAASVPLTKFIKSEYEQRYQENVTAEFVDAVWVITSSIFPVGGLFGSLLIGNLVGRFGRLKSLLLCHVVVLMMSFLLAMSKVFRLPEIIILARFCLGVTSAAGGTGISPMYITEISPKHVRGIFGSLVGTGMSIGIFGANTFGLPSVLSTDALWPVLFALTGLPSLFFVIFYKLLPESPRELFMENGDTEGAIDVLRSMNGIFNVSPIIQDMAEEKVNSKSTVRLTVRQLLSRKSLYPAVIASLVLAAAQQMTGVNGIIFYMNDAFVEAGIPDGVVPYTAVGVSGTVIFINLACVFMTERYGRKIMLCSGYTIEAVSLVLITIFIQLQHLSPVLPYLTVVSSLGFFCGFGLGSGIVTHVVIPELFDQSSRSAGMVVSSVVIWVSFTLCVVITPYMLAYIGGYTFVPFLALAVATIFFTAMKVPETKNKSFAEINAELLGKRIYKKGTGNGVA